MVLLLLIQDPPCPQDAHGVGKLLLAAGDASVDALDPGACLSQDGVQCQRGLAGGPRSYHEEIHTTAQRCEHVQGLQEREMYHEHIKERGREGRGERAVRSQGAFINGKYCIS